MDFHACCNSTASRRVRTPSWWIRMASSGPMTRRIRPGSSSRGRSRRIASKFSKTFDQRFGWETFADDLQEITAAGERSEDAEGRLIGNQPCGQDLKRAPIEWIVVDPLAHATRPNVTDNPAQPGLQAIPNCLKATET